MLKKKCSGWYFAILVMYLIATGCSRKIHVVSSNGYRDTTATQEKSETLRAISVRWWRSWKPWRIDAKKPLPVDQEPAGQAGRTDFYRAVEAYTTGSIREKTFERAGAYEIITGIDRWGVPRAYARKPGLHRKSHSDTLLLLTKMIGGTLHLDEAVLKKHPDLPLDIVCVSINHIPYDRKAFNRIEEAYIALNPSQSSAGPIRHGILFIRLLGDSTKFCNFIDIDEVYSIPAGASRWTERNSRNDDTIGKDAVLWTRHVNWSAFSSSQLGAGDGYVRSLDRFTEDAQGTISTVDDGVAGGSGVAAAAVGTRRAGGDTVLNMSRQFGAETYDLIVTSAARKSYLVFAKPRVSAPALPPTQTPGAPVTPVDAEPKADSAKDSSKSAQAGGDAGATKPVAPSPASSQETVTQKPQDVDAAENAPKIPDPVGNSVPASPAATAADSFRIDGRVNVMELAGWLKKPGVIGDKSGVDQVAQDISDRITQFQASTVVDSLRGEIIRIGDSLNEQFNGAAGQFILNKRKIQVYNREGRPIRNEYFEPVSVTIRTDYNRINVLLVTGNLHLPNGAIEKMVVGNRFASLTIFRLNTGRLINSSNYDLTKINYHGYTLELMNRKDEFIAANEAVLFIPKREHYHNMVKNQDIFLDARNNWRADVLRRSLNDYLSLRIFLDPFGFLSNTPNGLLQAEGHVTLPMNIRRPVGMRGGWRAAFLFPEQEATFSTVYAASSNSAMRVITPDTVTKAISSVNSPFPFRNYVNNFDFFRKYNVQFNYRLSLLTREFRDLNLWAHLRIGFDAYGANGLLYKDTLPTKLAAEPISTYLAVAYPVAGLKFEFRPDANYGLYVTLDYLFFGGHYYLGNNIYNSRLNADFTFNTDFLIRNELTYYARVGERSSGGLFFRMTNHLSKYFSKNGVDYGAPGLDTKRTWAFFPQILIGYSTNISAFVKQVNNRQ